MARYPITRKEVNKAGSLAQVYRNTAAGNNFAARVTERVNISEKAGEEKVKKTAMEAARKRLIQRQAKVRKTFKGTSVAKAVAERNKNLKEVI